MAGPKRRASSRRSRQVERGTYGTHIQRKSGTSQRQRNSTSFGKGSAARQRTGEIRQVMPKTKTRESSSAYAQRNRQSGFMVGERKRNHLRTVILAALAIIAVLVVAAGVTWLVFKAQASAKLHFDDPALAEVLSAPETEEDPYYILLAGTLEDSMREADGPHLLNLVRIDPVAHAVTMLSLPHNIEMMMSDDEYHMLSYAQILGGNAELVTQVENLCGVEISHMVMLDAEDFVALVDALGGITVNLEQEADDPDTGSIYIPAGVQTLNGEQALTLVRCDNYTTPLETRSKVQSLVVETLARTVLAKSTFGLARTVDVLAGDVQTTMTFDDLWSLLQLLKEGDEVVFYSGMVPGFVTVDPDGTFFSVNRVLFDSMMEAVREGRNPNEAATISGLTPSLVKITILNGAGITGGAAQLAETLEAVGYQVPEKGNTDNPVYDETFVVYKSDLMKPTAEDILAVIGNGRTVEAGLFHDFDTDILVIIGKDWVPTH